MSKFEDTSSCLKEIEDRYNNSEKVKKKLANYNEPIQVTFLDTGRRVLILVNGDQGIQVKDNTGDAAAPVKIDFTSEKTLIDLFNKDIGAVKAYSSGDIKVIEGKIRNLLKLKSLLF
ncbi:MAG: SCP2 sterol-binding domain-containing protein [Promethearchaeota archaeon]|jgi:putative sterol carrier protein